MEDLPSSRLGSFELSVARDWKEGGEEEDEVSSSISLTFERNERKRGSPADEEKDRE